MPSLGADMTEGVLVGWLKSPGETVRKGDVIAEVETDKGVIQVEAFVSGTLDKILVKPGTTTPVGTLLAIIREDGQAAPPPRAAMAASTTEPLPRRSPVITRDDDKSERMRRAIAAAMEHSKREIPHYYVSETIDMQAALDWLAGFNAKFPVAQRILYGTLLIKAAAMALRDFPEFNASWQNGRVVAHPSIHIGVAITLRSGGLVAPALRDADRQSLSEIMINVRDLAERAKSGSLRASDLSDATVTVTSLGDRGAESACAVIVPPQTAIIAFGRIVERPWAVEGRVVVRSTTMATLSADHRASDAHRGGLFLAAISRLLQAPAAL